MHACTAIAQSQHEYNAQPICGLLSLSVQYKNVFVIVCVCYCVCVYLCISVFVCLRVFVFVFVCI